MVLACFQGWMGAKIDEKWDKNVARFLLTFLVWFFEFGHNFGSILGPKGYQKLMMMFDDDKENDFDDDEDDDGNGSS